MVASYLEVYNDQIFDLLDESGNRKVRLERISTSSGCRMCRYE